VRVSKALTASSAWPLLDNSARAASSFLKFLLAVSIEVLPGAHPAIAFVIFGRVDVAASACFPKRSRVPPNVLSRVPLTSPERPSASRSFDSVEVLTSECVILRRPASTRLRPSRIAANCTPVPMPDRAARVVVASTPRPLSATRVSAIPASTFEPNHSAPPVTAVMPSSAVVASLTGAGRLLKALTAAVMCCTSDRNAP
jgi:hypothetical protein